MFACLPALRDYVKRSSARFWLLHAAERMPEAETVEELLFALFGAPGFKIEHRFVGTSSPLDLQQNL